MQFSARDMMKTDRLALLLVALALIVAGTVVGVRSCSRAPGAGDSPAVIVDTVRVARNSTVKSDSDSVASRHKADRKGRGRKGKGKPKKTKVKAPPVPRDYGNDVVPPAR